MNPSTSFFIFLSWSIGYHPYPNKSLDEMKIRVNACSGTLPSAKKCRDPGLIPIAETLLHLLFFLSPTISVRFWENKEVWDRVGSE